MHAAWYDRQGSSGVLRVGQLPTPEPGPGEVRVRLTYSGVNPGDVKKRAGREGSRMPFPRVVPHSDGAGVVDAVGTGVDPDRVGHRVWVWGAQSYRPLGTAAEWTVVPADRAVDAPAALSDRTGATLGIPGITAHRAVFGDGDVNGLLRDCARRGMRAPVRLVRLAVAVGQGDEFLAAAQCSCTAC